MHLPYPKRRSSDAPLFLPRGTGSYSSSSFGRGFLIPRRYRQQVFAIAGLALIALIWLLSRGGGSYNGRGGGGSGLGSHSPAGKPPTVLVTVIDPVRFGVKYTELVKENRKLYATKHGMSPRQNSTPRAVVWRVPSLRRGQARRTGCKTDRQYERRLRYILPTNRRLRSQRGAHVVDEGSGIAACPHAISWCDILLVYRRRHIYHEPTTIDRERHHGAGQARTKDAGGLPRRAARQHNPHLQTPTRGGRRLCGDAGQGWAVNVELPDPELGVVEVLPGDVVRSHVSELQLPEGGDTRPGEQDPGDFSVCRQTG